MSKITQPDVYNFELDSHDIHILNSAICALKDAHPGKLQDYLITEGYLDKLETMHSEIGRVLRDGHDCYKP